MSIANGVGGLLQDYEKFAGDGTVRRFVVIDREGQVAWLFKDLTDRHWDFIVPLKRNVTGPNAEFRELTDWSPYGTSGDEVRGGVLRLNDSRTRDEVIDVRVVGRKRHRTGKIAWYATRADAEDFSDATILDLYFARWPLQELVFRDGNGRVHLGAHHGYGKMKIDNVAVIDKIDKLDSRARRLEGQIEKLEGRCDELLIGCKEHDALIVEKADQLDGLRTSLDAALTTKEAGSPSFARDYATVQELERDLTGLRANKSEQKLALLDLGHRIAQTEASTRRTESERARLEQRRQIFTVDTELDQAMTAFKITFMNLCSVFMRRYLGGRSFEIDTLIRGIFSLPGERVRTPTRETIRIWYQPRDRELMPLVEAACKQLTARGLVRDKRRLSFEVVERPDA